MTDERRRAGAPLQWLVIGWLGGLVFLLVALVVASARAEGFDQAIIAWVTAHRSAPLTTVAREATALANGTTLVVLALVIGVLARPIGGVRLAVLPLAAVASGIAINYLAKSVFGRDRPDLLEWLTHAGHAAFPSGHALYAAAAYLTFAFVLGSLAAEVWLKRLIWVVAAGIILAAGLSRVYLGVHWPSDVIGGWALGAAVAGGCISLMGRRAGAER